MVNSHGLPQSRDIKGPVKTIQTQPKSVEMEKSLKPKSLLPMHTL